MNTYWTDWIHITEHGRKLSAPCLNPLHPSGPEMLCWILAELSSSGKTISQSWDRECWLLPSRIHSSRDTEPPPSLRALLFPQVLAIFCNTGLWTQVLWETMFFMHPMTCLETAPCRFFTRSFHSMKLNNIKSS